MDILASLQLLPNHMQCQESVVQSAMRTTCENIKQDKDGQGRSHFPQHLGVIRTGWMSLSDCLAETCHGKLTVNPLYMINTMTE